MDVPQTIIDNTRDFINAMANGSGIGMPSLWVESNDRIVPITSERGGLAESNTTVITGVDHLNVHQGTLTADKVKGLLDEEVSQINQGRFSLEGF